MSWNTKAAILGAMVFAIVFFGAIFLITLYCETRAYKKRGETPPYWELFDERQTLIRLRAGTHAFYMLIAYLLLWLFFDLQFAGEGAWAWTRRPAVLVAGGLCLAVSVFAGECALRDAFVGWNNKKPDLGIKIVLCLVWGVNAAIRGSVIDEPVLAAVLYLCAGAMAVLSVIFIYAYLHHKKKERQE